ncbi:MAG TPA: D-alanine--D-alanine ligase family protein [Thermomicrobiales bacterium]|nr:D-alanine--D-alanine ligase family protein [Thermomicrobiales bacterium]
MTESGSARRKVRIGVLFGGRSAEHDVSLRSAITVMGALDPSRFDVVPIGITRDGHWLTGGDPMQALTAASPMFHLGVGEDSSSESVDRETAMSLVEGAGSSASSGVPAGLTESFDVIFPVLHGPMGEDGTVQGMLELARVPYVGSGVVGSAVAMDKAMTKSILDRAGLPQLPWRLVTRRQWQVDPDGVAAALADAIGFPCFVKPANLGSSVGISKVKHLEELAAAMTLAAYHDRRIVVEQGVNGRELELGVLGNEDPIASMAGEIVPHGEFYDYNAKYVEDTAELVIPAQIDSDLLVQLQQLAIDAYRALDLAGLSRVDFFLEHATDRIYVNEVNTIPGFTSISMYPMLWEASGVPLPELVERLVQLAVDRYNEMN